MGKNLKWATRLMLKLADITDAQVKSIQTDKGTLYLVDSDEPDTDVEVYVEDKEGIRTMPEDGGYIYENYRLEIADGVIIAKSDITADGQTEELKDRSEAGKKGKISRLKPKANLPEVVEVVNDIIDALEELADPVEQARGETEDVPVVEELRSVKAKLAALSPLKGMVEKTVAALEELGSRSNGTFEHPNPAGRAEKKGPGMSTKEILDYYKKK